MDIINCSCGEEAKHVILNGHIIICKGCAKKTAQYKTKDYAVEDWNYMNKDS